MTDSTWFEDADLELECFLRFGLSEFPGRPVALRGADKCARPDDVDPA